VAAPIFGAISDRTTSRFGRRKIWIAAGCTIVFAGLCTMALATGLVTVGLGWLLVQIGSNAALSAAFALLPDFVPPHQQGRMSPWLGIALSAALLTGTCLSRLTVNNSFGMFLVPWLLSPIALFLLFRTFKDRPAAPAAPFSMADLLRTFWVNPHKYPDFGWAFPSRFLVFMGVAYFISYQFIFIVGRLHLSEDRALDALFLSQLETTVLTVTFTLISGCLSDRIGRRKPIVLIAGLLVAVGLVLIGLSATLTMVLIGAAIYGVGQGVYFAVDMALVAAVSPNPDATAKDLGVFNIASTLPQTIAPAIAPLFLGIGAVAGGSLAAVFTAGAAFALLGALVVLPIRGTR
jgi:MFS family permease